MTQGGTLRLELEITILISNGFTMPDGTYGESWIDLGAEFETSRSESDSIPFGDHDFDRTTGRSTPWPRIPNRFVCRLSGKVFGWPGMYTANPNNYETEVCSHDFFTESHSKYGGDNNFEMSALDAIQIILNLMHIWPIILPK